MNNKKKYSPVVVAGMTVATVAGVAFAIWNITRTLSPPSEPAPTAATPTANTPAPGTVAVTTPGESDQTAVNPGASARRTTTSEATLAPQADPFAPLAVAQLPPIQNQLPVQQAAPVVERPLPGIPLNLPVTPLEPRIAARDANARAEQAESAETPDLIGTLTGQRPSAVFRSKDGVVVVPSGTYFGSWKVVRVVHGGAVLISGKRRITIGTTIAGAIQASRMEDPRSAGAESLAARNLDEGVEAPTDEGAPDGLLVAEAVNPTAAPVTSSDRAHPAPAPSPADKPSGTDLPISHEIAPAPKTEGSGEGGSNSDGNE